jgi:PAS domain S-box-containing protein
MEGTMKMINKIHHLFRLNTLKRRLRFWFILLILLFVVLRFISLNLYEKVFLQIQAHNNIQQIINLQQLVIDKWFEDKSTTIQAISQLPDVRALDEGKMKKVLETFHDHYTEFSSIAFVNKQGVSEINTSRPPGVDFSDRRYYQEAKKGQGLILGSVRLDSINKVMEKLHFSETGQTYLVNREGMLLTEPRFPSPVMKKETNTDFSTKINTEIFHQASQGKSVIQSYQDYRGSIVFGDYRWVNDHKWLIIGEITKNDVFLPIQRIMMTFSAAMIIFLLVGLSITFLLSKRVDQVIHQVLEGAHQMGKAKYSYRIDPSSYAHYAQEVQELCRTFNDMAAMIQYQMHSVQKSEERYRALVETSPNAIVVLREGEIVYANPRFTRLLKAASEDNLIGKNIIQYVHSDYHGIVKERIKQLERNIPVGLSEEKYVLLDGSIIDVEVIATPIEYSNRPAFQVIMQDISKRKEIENELKKSQEQYRSVVENVKEVIFQTDVQGKWTFINQAWEEITGYSINKSIGNLFFDYVYPDDQKRNYQLFQSLIESKQECCRDEIRFITMTLPSVRNRRRN